MAPLENTPREAELAALLNGAIVGCAGFLKALLTRIEAHAPQALEGIKVRVEYSPPGSTRRFDLYLRREEPALSVAFELKRDEVGLHEQQIREYLAMLGLIHEDGSLRRRRHAPKFAQLVVITGATEMPEIIEEISQKGGGFLKEHLVWLSWYELADLIEDLDEEDRQRPLINQLRGLLSEQGYVSYGDALPRLKQQERLLARLHEASADGHVDEDLRILEATLGRMEHQMAKHQFGVTLRANVRGRKTAQSRQRIVKLGKPLKVFGVDIRSLGRTFLPNSDIRQFARETKSTKTQQSGVGIAYSVHSRNWVAYIRPERTSPLAKEILQTYSTRDRVPLDYGREGIIGWELKGRQKQPETTARFLVRLWTEYQELQKGDA